MEIIRYYNTLALHFECSILSTTHWHNVYAHIVYKKKSTLTDYHTIIETGCFYTDDDEALPLAQDKYLWLLQWKDIIYQWRYSLPKTLNPVLVIPHTPPTIKKLSSNEKRIIKRLKAL